MKTKTTIALFLTLLAGLVVLNLLTPSKKYSENENRYLRQLPEFSWDRLINGAYTADFDAYLTDQFVFRDSWVGGKALSELALQKHASNGVYFAKNGYLIEMFPSVDQSQYEKNLEFVKDFSLRVKEELGIEVNTILVPTASMILANHLPAYTPEVDQQKLLNLANSTIPGFVDISGILSEHSGEYIYYKTDHHWTSLGAMYGYSHWREQTGKTGVSLQDYTEEILNDRFFGTTYSKASLYTAKPDVIISLLPKNLGPIQVSYDQEESVTDTIYECSYLDKKDKYSVFLNANQPMTHITTSNNNGEKLLLIKDSYANTFVQMALADYQDIYVIDLRYFKLPVYHFIKDNDVKNVLLLYNTKGFSTDTNLYYLST